MKKEYKAPKVERMEFNYSDTVVASGCGNTTTYSQTNAEGEYCQSKIYYHYVADNGN